jgi:PAP2 superfamily protein
VLRPSFLVWVFGVCITLACAVARAGGGPLGIDHRLSFDNSGIWKRSNQTALRDLLVAGELAGGIYEGGESRLGKTFWQSIDSSALAAISSEALKHTFTRARPIQNDDPNSWFQGSGHYSFPSDEVASVTAIVTPFILEYRSEHPSIYALEVLPLYDAIGRMKQQAHWQTDVLAGFALGTVTSYYAHNRDRPFLLSFMPHRIFVGLRKNW